MMRKKSDPVMPAVTTEQMREIDRLMVEEFGIQLIQMMENAGIRLAELALEKFGRIGLDARVVILCGTGNNGGGGMVAARHLHNRGVKVRVSLIGCEVHLKKIPNLQWQTIKKLGIMEVGMESFQEAGLVLDCMIGYGLRGDPNPLTSKWIDAVNQSGVHVLALDAPSGMDATTGVPSSSCIQADVTLTLALPKTGLLEESARPYVGDLFLADIGVPPEIYELMGMKTGNIFSTNPIIYLDENAVKHARGQ